MKVGFIGGGSWGTTLANLLKDYIKKGGDINNLTPDNIFKKWFFNLV